ncbi:MAG TPA: squalene/phytoene synthase family protein [Kofleriaceae bacterium]|nr:squalene/phytoene synthase family protein [Kofleriaceae bacterium]
MGTCYPVNAMFAHGRAREHARAVLAFVHGAEAIVDEPSCEGRRARELDRWEDDLDRAYRGHAEHPVFAALAQAVDEHALAFGDFAALIEACRIDLERTRYATFDELRTYLRCAVEPLGRILANIAGGRAAQLHACAGELSIGLAIAQLLRDIAGDHRRGRVYVPAEDLRHFGVSPDDLAARRSSPAVAMLVRYEISRARTFFERARPIADTGFAFGMAWRCGVQLLAAFDHGSARPAERELARAS